MRPSKAREGYGRAARCLVSRLDHEERLQLAGRAIVGLPLESFPDPDLRVRHERIAAAFTQQPPWGNDGSVQTSVRAMPEDEREGLSAAILSLYAALREEYGRQSPDRALS